jgi:citrate lyase subunit beta/citryl-CoA lyase
VTVPPLTWLYAPGDRLDLVEKALASRAHAVIVDLEDGARDKALARENLNRLPSAEKPLYVRLGSTADLDAVAGLELAGTILPKVERPEDVVEGVTNALIESALGVENAFAIAQRVRGISLGESDLRSNLGATDLDWARARIVNAAVAAGLPQPPQSVYPHVRDLEGLAASSRRGRELGHLGRAAIHPDQLETIERAYLPTDDELERARATVERLEAGAGMLADGAFVDAAMLGVARQTIAIAEAYG